MTGAQVGQALERSASWVSRVETGRMALRARDLKDLLDVYGIRDPETRDAHLEMIDKERRQGWWSHYRSSLYDGYVTFIGLENDASLVESYENVVIPGLLQTEDYARALLQLSALRFNEREIEDRVAVRMTRQRHVLDHDPPVLRFVIEATVLERAPGDNAVLVRQLDRLTGLASAGVRIQVIAHDGGLPGAGIGSFTLLHFGDPELTVAYVENLAGGVFEEGAEAAKYRRLFEYLTDRALAPQDSLDVIARTRAEVARRR